MRQRFSKRTEISREVGVFVFRINWDSLVVVFSSMVAKVFSVDWGIETLSGEMGRLCFFQGDVFLKFMY